MDRYRLLGVLNMTDRRDPHDSDYDGIERRAPRPERWHVRKEIQISHLISTVALAVAAIMYVQKQDTRLSLVEQRITDQKEQINSAIDSVSARLERIDTKLDRLIERRTANGESLR